jgi:uncharacterized protein (TIGR02246 family)
MKAVIPLACLALVAAPALADPAAEARAHSEAFARAMAARDLDAVLALYADDARVIFPGAGEEARGKAEIAKLVAASFAASPDSSPVLVSQDVVPLADGLLAVLGRWKMEAKAPDGGVETVHVRTSEVIRRVDGRLLYVVDHASVGVPPPAPEARPAP